MKLESVKKHTESRQHKDAEAAQRTSARPHRTPMELAVQTMEQSEVEQMKCLFNTGFYLVEAERPFRDFLALKCVSVCLLVHCMLSVQLCITLCH